MYSSRPGALLWDIDGTLVDTTALIVASLDHVYRAFLDRTLPKRQIRAIIGTPLWSQIRVFGDPESFGRNPEEMEAEFIRYYEENRQREKIIRPAIDALIAGARAGIPGALVTSKNREELGNTLPRLGIADSVRVIVSADDVAHPKPHPEGVLRAIDRLQVLPAAAIYIGDTVHDIRAGRAAGVRTCAVTWGAGTRADLRREDPEILCEDPRSLPEALGY